MIILTGIEGVKWFESFSAPLLIGGSMRPARLGFRRGRRHRQRVLDLGASSSRATPRSGRSSGPSLAANVGYWITLSLNIPDFTRYAQSQRSQVVGQALGLPLTMTAFSFIGIAVTAATIVVFDEAIWDPVALVTRLTSDIPLLLILAMFIIAIAQISTNMAANVVSPSFDFSNLAPKYISFRTGGIITAIIGVVSFPWLILETAGAYIFTWLVGYGSLLGAIGAVMIVDYWIVRGRQLDLADLYKHDGRYSYSGGWNWRAIVGRRSSAWPPSSLVSSRRPPPPNFTGVFPNPTFIESLYNYGLFFTFGVAGAGVPGALHDRGPLPRNRPANRRRRRRMPDASTFALFVAAALVLLLVPGPAVIYVVARSVEGGPPDGARLRPRCGARNPTARGLRRGGSLGHRGLFGGRVLGREVARRSLSDLARPQADSRTRRW